MEVKYEFPYNPRRSFKDDNPFAIVFVYTQKGASYIIKGGILDIENEYKNICIPAIVHETYWHHSRHRASIRLLNLPNINICKRKGFQSLFSRLGIDAHKNWIVFLSTGSVFDVDVVREPSGSTVTDETGSFSRLIVTLRRLPRKWIKELDPFIANTANVVKKELKFQGRLIEL
jgi:hypothetical protein